MLQKVAVYIELRRAEAVIMYLEDLKSQQEEEAILLHFPPYGFNTGQKN